MNQDITGALLPEISSEQRTNMRFLLEQCRQSYEDRKPFFRKRRRSFRYYIGNQWGDAMEDPASGKTMTEEDYIRSQGRLPAQNNQIGTVIRNLIGQFRSNYPDPVAFGRNRDKAQAGEIMTAALQRAIDINEANELDARNFEELLVSASVGWKISFQWWRELNMNDVYIENIDQTRFFYNMDSGDVRGHDVFLCGEIHDMRMDDVIASFAKSKEDAERIRKMFPHAAAYEYTTNRYPDYLRTYRSFYNADEPDRVRVIEAWRLENRWESFVHDMKDGSYRMADDAYFMELGFSEEEVKLYDYEELIYFYNQRRVETAVAQGVDPNAVPLLDIDTKYEGVWRAYYLTPLGEVLFESDTPYGHEGNPYIFGGYPLMDGKTQSVVDSIIDQQRQINRLISLMDHALGTSIKNLMWVPKEILPDGMTPKQFSEQAVELNGMIFYEHDPSIPLPKPISTNANIAGSQELLMLQMNLLKEISAVNEAVQGLEPKAGTPASLYAQQAANATTTNKDIFEFYTGLLRKRNRKVIQIIQEFYTEKRYIKISGSGFSRGVEQVYDPEKVQGVDFDVVLGETQDTLSYRQLVDTYLKDFLNEQRITFEEYLQHTSLPFADQLLQTLKNRMDGVAGGFPPEIQEQIAQGNIPPQLLQQMQAQGGV